MGEPPIAGWLIIIIVGIKIALKNALHGGVWHFRTDPNFQILCCCLWVIYIIYINMIYNDIYIYYIIYIIYIYYIYMLYIHYIPIISLYSSIFHKWMSMFGHPRWPAVASPRRDLISAASLCIDPSPYLKYLSLRGVIEAPMNPI